MGAKIEPQFFHIGHFAEREIFRRKKEVGVFLKQNVLLSSPMPCLLTSFSWRNFSRVGKKF